MTSCGCYVEALNIISEYGETELSPKELKNTAIDSVVRNANENEYILSWQRTCFYHDAQRIPKPLFIADDHFLHVLARHKDIDVFPNSRLHFG